MNERLRELREAFGFTQSEMAERIGMKQSNYSLIESGATKIPQILFVALAELGANLNWLVTGNGLRMVMPEEVKEEMKKNAETEENAEIVRWDKHACPVPVYPHRRKAVRVKCVYPPKLNRFEKRLRNLEYRMDKLEEVI